MTPLRSDDPTLPRRLALALGGWWLLFAASWPVTVWDSYAYNLARLRVAELGGFFHNQGWNSERQIFFPWSFDAVHLPTLWLGAGSSLPSYACFLGLLWIAWRWIEPRWGEARAWWAVASLFALPTLVMQATSSKNDLVVVFGLACWAYSLRCWLRQPSPLHLVFGPLGLAFAAGSKLSGLLPSLLALGFQSVLLARRQAWSALGVLLPAFAGAFLLVGPVDTFVLNQREFGNPFGPASFVESHRNRDGLAGAAANAVRYFAAGQSLGVDARKPNPPAALWLAESSKRLLTAVGLEEKGFRPDFNAGNAEFLKTGTEAASDYSLLGALALWVGLWVVLRRPRHDPLFQAAAVAWGSFCLTSATIGWMPWNARFLLLPFSLLTLVFVLVLLEPPRWSAWRPVLLLFLLGVGAVYAPLCSYNRKPTDLPLAWLRRAELVYRERPSMREVMSDLRSRFPAGVSEKPVLLYQAGSDSWVLALWNVPGVELRPVSRFDAAMPAATARARGARPTYLLRLNPEAGAPGPDPGWKEVRRYFEKDTVLFQWQGGTNP